MERGEASTVTLFSSSLHDIQPLGRPATPDDVTAGNAVFYLRHGIYQVNEKEIAEIKTYEQWEAEIGKK